MGLHIVVGFPDIKNKKNPVPVYVGESAGGARAAMEADQSCAHYQVFNNPAGYRKRNPAFGTGALPAEVSPESNETESPAEVQSESDSPTDPTLADAAATMEPRPGRRRS